MGERKLLYTLDEALRSGVGAVQLREKDLAGRELFDLARKTKKLTDTYNAKLFINDRVDVALAVRAAGIHLGENSLPVKDARKLCDEMIIGRSTHSLQGALNAEAEGADFVTFGPVFKTPSKVRYGPPVGLSSLAEVAREVTIPVFAIGGIKVGNVEEVMTEGAPFGIALISGVIEALSPSKASAQFLERTALYGRRRDG